MVVVDAFTKFVKFYPTKTTNTEEVIKNLSIYMNHYSRPKRIISDRGSCFTSDKFEKFCVDHLVEHIKTAAYTPEANGQVERMNRTLTPMLAKLIHDTDKRWDILLPNVEFIYNNTFNRSIKNYPSILLFGQLQNTFNKVEFNLETLVKNNQENIEFRNLVDIRKEAKDQIEKLQAYNKTKVDKKRKGVQDYKEGDFVVIKTVDTHKLSNKFKGPYVIKQILPNDRYLVTDIDGFQVSSLPYSSVCSPGNMRKLLSFPHIFTDDDNDEDIVESG